MSGTALLAQRGTFSDDPHQGLAVLREAIISLSEAADRGPQVLFAEARILFRNLLAVRDVRLLVRSAGAWREWEKLNDGADEALIERLPDSFIDMMRFEDAILVPVQVGSVALLVEGMTDSDALRERAATLSHVFRLAIASSETRNGNPDKLEAIRVFQRVANKILKSRNLQEIFLQITHEAKARLSADICGIMLLEEEALVMKRCTGNLAAETAALRMKAGQGVGGRVLETRQPCSIEDYVQSEIISRDFMSLARAERVRSALAVPLMSQDQVIGVLEVWRRKPSTFTPQHTAELATLANLASLAIENAALLDAREAAARELEDAHSKLQQRYNVIRNSADLQEGLISTLLDGGGLCEIAQRAHQHLHSPVLILDKHLDVQACHPRTAATDAVLRAVRIAISQNRGPDTRYKTISAGALRFAFQSITAGSEQLGWAVMLNPEIENESAQLAITELCVTAALHQTKERAAARALSDKLATLTWDLLEGTDHLRQLALQRAKELDAEIPAEYCIAVCRIDGLDKPDKSGVLTGGEIEGRRRSVAEAPNHLPGRQIAKLSGLRGNELALVISSCESVKARDFAQSLIVEIMRRVPGCTARVGLSRGCSEPMSIPSAWRDARIALDVACQSRTAAVIDYNDVGVAGLLMSIREGTDFQGFVGQSIGGLLKEKSPQRETLLQTLRVFFACNCSQQATARELRTHQKTIAYRLDKIERITGLKLAAHEQRVLLYLALQMNDLIR
ncbi:helix-turn-helix domain-containing protein [Bradyrhizobium septentrionale]|uniref:Helix-turn-helix domain-containing protein n=1 Tax=Bradyrhizobium septentrionale TaxID=1404411 RepID=A0A974A416_9BRAD|nr:helix-turn-helix domain-containing protein [Bradyrhizobium septentrionale]UGY16321.1 helix-turn-helix domain-containing protein [Bradyrhizobium septentrionale]